MIGLILSLFLTVFNCLQIESWRGIAPLNSNRKGVEKVLGKSETYNKKDGYALYKTKTERIVVIYSVGNCKNGWDIAKGKVIRIEITPKKRIKLKEYDFDESKFIKYLDPHVSYYTAYVNEENGIMFLLDTGSNEIITFEYFPKSKHDFLKC